MSNITKNHKVGIFAIFLASVLMLGTISASGVDSAFATKNNDKHDDKSKDKKKSGNKNEQKIEQESDNRQDGQCVGAATIPILPLANCNQIGVSVNLQAGNQAVAQD